jgi:rhodanese-related sulfurtransferase
MSLFQRRTFVLGLLLSIGISMSASSHAQPTTESVSLETARAEAAAGRAVLIDIREPDETARGVAAGAVLLPMSQLQSRLAEIPVDPRQPVFLVCNSQNRSRATLKALRERGYGHARYVEGGMSEWVRRGWPLVAPGR